MMLVGFAVRLRGLSPEREGLSAFAHAGMVIVCDGTLEPPDGSSASYRTIRRAA
jgi:hypothetical protein